MPRNYKDLCCRLLRNKQAPPSHNLRHNVTIYSYKSLTIIMSPPCLRAASPKYQLDMEIAKISNFSKLTQNEALRPLVTKILFQAR